MPYKSEYTHKVIPRELDRRVKISLSERDEIRRLYGTISQRKLAKMFNVSRRLIIFIGCPEKHKKNLEDRKRNGGSAFYYNREKQTKAIRETRKYRKILNKQNKLTDKK